MPPRFHATVALNEVAEPASDRRSFHRAIAGEAGIRQW
jgi:hypothetical protein